MSISPAVDKDTVIARARAAIENRTKYIESLFDAAQASAAARERAAEATRAADSADAGHAAAYKAAIDAGWTVAELIDSGLTAPSTPISKKTRKPSTKRTVSRGTARRRVGAEHAPGHDRQDAPHAGETDTPVDAPPSSPAPVH